MYLYDQFLVGHDADTLRFDLLHLLLHDLASLLLTALDVHALLSRERDKDITAVQRGVVPQLKDDRHPRADAGVARQHRSHRDALQRGRLAGALVTDHYDAVELHLFALVLALLGCEAVYIGQGLEHLSILELPEQRQRLARPREQAGGILARVEEGLLRRLHGTAVRSARGWAA